ncbi:hypothetical protein LCGC14_0471720 [marine sediment metagenome]|uniref:Tyr recombinase domain-containing protein n=1 Tax=marine sediment metagenome TaxID=412755 RepID=A0A0F9SC56_9ZZZZ|nr:MAG: Tyrosine recombinase XerC [Candidatus Lokiarchaeum sp. GC14_75]HEC37614.1 hypothetical protein [bacterium]
MCKYGLKENEPIVEEFLLTIRSEKFRINVKTSLKNFFGNEALNHGWNWEWAHNIFEIKPSVLNLYNNYINQYSEWAFKTKISRFGHVKKFIKFLLKCYEDEFGERTYDRLRADLNEKDYYEWDQEYNHKQPETAYKRYFMPKEQIKKILTHFCDRKPIYYLMFRLLAESGLRKGELHSINLERNVEGKIIPIEEDLEERQIRVMGKKGLLKYPITETMKNQLLSYLRDKRCNFEVKDKYGKPLFLSQQLKRFNPTSLNTMLMGTTHKDGSVKRPGVLRKLGIEDHITPQTFRRSLNELRASITNCPDKWLAILLNHKIKSDSQKSGTNIQYYQDKNFQKILEKYDLYYPYRTLFDDLYY